MALEVGVVDASRADRARGANPPNIVPGRLLTSRLYETEYDLRQMQDLLMKARSRTNDWRYAHVGELMWGFFMVICHLNPQEHIRLWHDEQDKLVAYAILGKDPSFDCQVLSEYEWSAIEAEALAWAETRISELRKRDAGQWSGHLVSGARQDDAERIAFLEQHGFRYSGRFAEVNMLRSLDEPIPEPVVPPGCQIRGLAETGDTSNRAGAQRDVWLPWTVGNVSDDDYAHLMQLPGYHRDLDVVAVAPDGIIAVPSFPTITQIDTSVPCIYNLFRVQEQRTPTSATTPSSTGPRTAQV